MTELGSAVEVSRQLLRFDAPVVGWLVGDILPDGSLEPAGGRVEGGTYTGTVNAFEACERAAQSVGPPRLGGRGLRPLVAVGHPTPFPFCECGFPSSYEPGGRWFDHYRDRLGYRMRTVALVEVWGRLMLSNAGVRGEYGRVLAIAASPDDAPQRRRRAAAATERLGAALFEAQPEAFNLESMARLIPVGAVVPTHRDFERFAHDRSLRRWTSRAQMRSISGIARAGGSATVLIAFLIAIGLGALGAPEAATIPVAVAVGVAALAFSLYKLPDFEYCVEASAPAPAGAPKLPTTELIPVALGAPELNLVPVLGEVGKIAN
jgi:hypothetical protein